MRVELLVVPVFLNEGDVLKCSPDWTGVMAERNPLNDFGAASTGSETGLPSAIGAALSRPDATDVGAGLLAIPVFLVKGDVLRCSPDWVGVMVERNLVWVCSMIEIGVLLWNRRISIDTHSVELAERHGDIHTVSAS